MSVPESLRTLHAVEHELEAWRTRRAALDAEFDQIHTRREAAVAARFAELDDEQILTDDAIRAWALAHETFHSGTYQRMRELAKPTIPEVVIHGSDGREGFEHLLRPTVILEKNSDIAVVTAELALWTDTWLMGRQNLLINVLEWSLSATGSYGIRWSPSTKRAVLYRDESQEVAAGSLHDVLSYVAEHHPYNQGRDLYDAEEY